MGENRATEGTMEANRIVDLLAATPARLRELVAGVDDGGSAAPAGEEWAPLDVLAHVVAANAILAPRLLQILVRPGVTLPAFDERRWAELTARARLTPAALLDLFAAERAALVGLARTLTPAEWALEGQHEVARARSVRQIAAHMAEHEREHIAQLRALVEAA